MRTTLAIDDDVLSAVKDLARNRATSVGETATMLLRRGLEIDCPTKTVNGLLVFSPGADSPEVTSATVRRLVEDDD